MVDWATQDRLYPPGYRTVDIRYRRAALDSSLPFSVASNKRHNCRLNIKHPKTNELLLTHMRGGLNQAIQFYNNLSSDEQEDGNPKLLATYTPNMHWPRSVCCLSATDGSLVICEQDRCLLLLFTSQLMLRSKCGGERGTGPYQFDSPWSVASLFDKNTSGILVADANNRRLQHFNIGYNGRFLHKQSFPTKEKPYYVTTSQQHFAVSCERGLIICYSAKEKKMVTQINLNKNIALQSSSSLAFPLCMDPESSFLFVSDSTASIATVLQLTITGEYLRSIKLDHSPFIHISALIFDATDQQLILVDSSNSIICSLDHDLDEDNLQILFKYSDHLNYPQGICLSNEGHLAVVECSVTSEHALKLFRYRPCVCHSRTTATSIKTSEDTSVRSMYFPF